LARDPDRWADLVGFDDVERVYASLHRDAHVDVWLLCWTPVNDRAGTTTTSRRVPWRSSPGSWSRTTCASELRPLE
jgi:hypothetical protein